MYIVVIIQICDNVRFVCYGYRKKKIIVKLKSTNLYVNVAMNLSFMDNNIVLVGVFILISIVYSYRIKARIDLYNQ